MCWCAACAGFGNDLRCVGTEVLDAFGEIGAVLILDVNDWDVTVFVVFFDVRFDGVEVADDGVGKLHTSC